MYVQSWAIFNIYHSNFEQEEPPGPTNSTTDVTYIAVPIQYKLENLSTLPTEHQNNLNYNKVFARDDSILDALRTNSVLENNTSPKQVV